MCLPETTLNRCSYVGQKGVCGKPCFREVCGEHTKRKSLPLCSICGVRGTTSKTGICNFIGTGCRWKSQVRSHKMKASADDMDKYVEWLIDTFVPPAECQSLTTGASGATRATSTTAPTTAGGT